MSHGHRHRNVTVKGVICPTGWGAGGEIERISIMTWDEDDYEIELEGVGRDLVEYLHCAVAVRGQILPEFRRRKVIRIKSFSVSISQDSEMAIMDAS